VSSWRTVALVCLLVAVRTAAADKNDALGAHVDDVPPDPDLWSGPALSTGYAFGKHAKVALLYRFLREPQLDTITTTSAIKLDLRVYRSWLVTVHGAITNLHSRQVSAGVRNYPYLGNTTLWVSRVVEPGWLHSVRSFVGFLYAPTVGVVLPTSTIPTKTGVDISSGLQDEYSVFKRNELGGIVGMDGRMDVFVRNAFYVQAGAGLQKLATGPTFAFAHGGAGLAPYARFQRVLRITAEWRYLREVGEPTALVDRDETGMPSCMSGDPKCPNGERRVITLEARLYPLQLLAPTHWEGWRSLELRPGYDVYNYPNRHHSWTFSVQGSL